MSKIAIDINGLTKNYGEHTVLNEIDMHINEPGVYLVAGPNGSGKTTLLEIMIGLRNFDGGKALIHNLKVNDVDIRKHVGFLTQQNTLRKNFTVAEELHFIKKLFKLDVDPYEHLKKYNLEEFYHQKTQKLSGGTKRRVLIAMLFMPEYNILILDEPVSGLDTFSRDEIWNMIRDYSEEHIILVSDHYLNQASQFSDYVYLLNKGKFVLHGKTEELVSDFKGISVVKTRRKHVDDFWSICPKEDWVIDSKVSGSVYNFFIKPKDNQTLHSIDTSNKYTLNTVNLEDIYFYYTGELIQGGVESG